MREVRYATGELAEIGDIWCTIPYTSPHYTIYKTVSCTDSNLTFDQSSDQGETWKPYQGTVYLFDLRHYYLVRRTNKLKVVKSGFAKWVERTHG